MRSEHYNDQWPSGSPMDVAAHFSDGQQPVVGYTLPNGDRITSTGSDYNRAMRFISAEEAGWRNAMNAKKRMALGLADENDLAMSAEFNDKWSEFKKNLTQQKTPC